MARKNIQGITIEIGGDTTKLQSALKGVESKLKSTQATLKDVNKLLKLDPGNTELLTQKQKLLGDSIKATKDKLETLKDAQEQMKAAGQVDTDEYRALQREIIETEQQLKGLTAEMKNFGSVAAQQIKAAGEKVKDLGGKIEKVGTGLTKYVTAPIVAVGAASVAAFNEVDEGLDTIAKKTGATGDALAEMEGIAMNLATSIPTDFQTAGAAVGEVETRFDLTGDALEELSGQFIKFAQLNNTDVTSSIDSVQAAMAAFGVSTDKASNVLDILNKAAQDTGVDVNSLTSDLTSNAAVLQQMGFKINSAAGFLANLNKNGMDSGAVLAGMKKALQNATKEGKSMSTALKDIEKSILGAKSETKALQVATELFGAKSAPAMVQAIRSGRLSLSDLQTQVENTANSVDKTFEETLDPIDEFKTAMNELKIAGLELVEAAAPLIKQIANMIQNTVANIRQWWGGLSPMAQETIVKVAAIAAAVGPLLIVGGKLVSVVGSIMGLAPKLLGLINTVKTAVSALWGVLAANPIGLVIAAVAALVAGFIYLWNNCEEFRQFWINLWEGIKNIAKSVGDWLVNAWKNVTQKAASLWTGLKDKIVGIWDGVKSKAESIWGGITNFVKNAIEKIKKFFSFQWELPKIPLPHFKIEGKFSLAPPQVPHLSIDWYKKAMENGMILNSPTIFGASGGKLLGGGDAGPEAVVGVDSLRSMIANAVNSGGSAGRQMTVILQLDRTELARTVFALNNSEVQRMGVRLST